MTVYLVWFDGWLEGYGTSLYLLGVYSTEEAAKNAKEEFIEEITENWSVNMSYIKGPFIEFVELDHTLKVECSDICDELRTGCCLGGYRE